MNTTDELFDTIEAALTQLRGAQRCECQAVDGYLMALREVIQVLDTFPVGVQTEQGEAAILGDRQDLIRYVNERIGQFDQSDEPAPSEPEQTLPTDDQVLKAVLAAITRGDFKAIRL